VSTLNEMEIYLSVKINCIYIYIYISGDIMKGRLVFKTLEDTPS